MIAAFLHPGILWGLLLAGVPVLIHVLNRRRFRRRAWAAMDFLLAALKKTRRRMLLEEILLLLLRVAAAAALALLAARPLSSGPGLLAALAGEKGAHHVVILDDSASMSQSAGGKTLLARAGEEVLQLAGALLEKRKGDRITVLLSSRPGAPLLDGRPLSRETLGILEKEIQGIAPTGLRLRPARLLALLAARSGDFSGPEKRRVAVYLFSDFRRSDWVGAAEGTVPSLRKSLDSLARTGTRLLLVPARGGSSSGAGITSLLPGGNLAAAGVPLEIRLRVRNQGNLPLPPLRPEASFEGRVVPLETLPPLAPGEEKEITFPLSFSTAGDHQVAVEIPGDDLPADNKRFLALHFRDSVRVLLAAPPGPPGSPGPAFYLQAALAPGEVTSGFSTDTCSPARAASRSLAPYDLVILAGAAAPPPLLAGHLLSFLEKGGGVLLFGGPQVISAAWNRTLGPLLPYPLGRAALSREAPRPGFLSDPSHPVWGKGKDLFARWLSSMALTGHNRPAGPLKKGARVLARVGGPGGDPLFTSIQKGKGRVLFSSISADGAWSGWVGTPLFPLFLQEGASWALPAPGWERWNAPCGSPLTVPLDPSVDSSRADLTLPGSPGPRILQAQADQVTWKDTSRPGIYELRIHSSRGDAARRVLRARNVDPLECLLARTTPGELEALYPQARFQWIPPERLGAWARSRRGDKTWRILAGALLLLLLLETWLGRRSARRGTA